MGWRWRLAGKVTSRILGVGGILVLLVHSGCQDLPFLPKELRSPKLPFRMSPLKHEVTLQPAPGMGPAPFTVDQAQAGPGEVKLTLSNPAVSPIRVVWAEATFITADSITYPIGLKGGPGQKAGSSPEPTTIESKGRVQVTVVAVTKEGQPVAPEGKSIDPPYRVGIKLTVVTGEKAWKGTLWVFVS
ncbi:MAG TPA: hypothetical protein VJM10_04085 [Candidatus Methylomirabilis sp.]|nr:hypothetical protein [Candidatus Methylomirabilis sp.]